MAAVALFRTRRYRALERRVGKLEERLAALRAGQVLRQEPPAEDPLDATLMPSDVAEPVAGIAANVVDRTPPFEGGAEEAKARPDSTIPGPVRILPTPTLPDIDWEQWIGVRGAALVGGIVLALAGLFFFRYSIEHGLIPPGLRVVLGTAAGVTCLAASERYLRRRYDTTANALVGAGVVILYAAFWAAHALYGLIGATPSFALMIGVTVTCAAFSWRHDSVVIALIGLAGGFATPLLLSTGSDRPIALFTYLLVLDGGLLYLARQKRWPMLALLGFLASAFYQIAWVLDRMGAERAPLGLAIAGVFGAVFLFAPRDDDEASPRLQWTLARGGGLLLPFAMTLHIAANAEFGPHLYPTAALLFFIGGAAAWLGHTRAQWWMGAAAAVASLTVVATWLMTRGIDASTAWECVAILVSLAAIFHVFVELDRDRAGRSGPAVAGIVSSLGGMVLLSAAAVVADEVAWWPWLVGWLALGVAAMRHGSFAERGALQGWTAGILAASMALLRLRSGFPSPSIYLLTLILSAVAFQVAAVWRFGCYAGLWGERAAAIFALLAGAGSVLSGWRASPTYMQTILSASLLGVLAMFAATRMPSGAWLFVATVATAATHWCLTALWIGDRGAPLAAVLALQLAVALLFAAWPLLCGNRVGREKSAWYAGAIALPCWFWSLRELFAVAIGDTAIGLLPITLGAAALAMGARARREVAADDPVYQDSFLWFVVAAFAFLTVAIPLQLDREWITLGWALEGAAAVWLWRQYDHVALKYFALSLLGAAAVRLVANPEVLLYYPRPSIRIVNWLAYTYLVPAGCLLYAAKIMAAQELERRRPLEASIYRGGHPVAAMFAGIAGLLVIFVWLNLAIADWFSTGARLTVSFERLPARDLATSIIWGLYALALLAGGVRLRSRGLRWASLALMALTLVKVFLYDLGELRDLYRVASLLGLAFSLISVSLAYQRFVFRDEEKEP